MKADVSRDILKYFKLNENDNVNYENLWNETKAVLSGKCIALNACIRKEDLNLII